MQKPWNGSGRSGKGEPHSQTVQPLGLMNCSTHISVEKGTKNCVFCPEWGFFRIQIYGRVREGGSELVGGEVIKVSCLSYPPISISSQIVNGF